jgi:hypothetical protein
VSLHEALPGDRISVAFGGSFTTAYENGGKQAGTYTRPSPDSSEWTKQ